MVKNLVFVGVAVSLMAVPTFGQVNFELAADNQGDPPEVVDDGWDGEAIRVTYDGQGNQSNGVSFDGVLPGPYDLLEFDFELRVWNEDGAGDADGIGFSYANVADHDNSGNVVWPTGEEPDLAGSLGIGFDTWSNGALDPPTPDATLPNSFSLHYDAQRIVSLDMVEFDLPDDWLQNGEPKRAHVAITPSGGDSLVSLSVSELGSNDVHSIFDNEKVDGMAAYDGRLVFRGRTGGENSNQDIDNISVTRTTGGTATTQTLFGRHVGGGGGGPPVAGPEPVFAGTFGSRPLEVEHPSVAGLVYTHLLHDANDPAVYDELEYMADRGYGFEVLDPDDDTNRRFGPFDDSPNNRGHWVPEDELYDSFIGFKNFAVECDEFVVGDRTSPCSTAIDAEGGIFRVDVPNGDYRFVAVIGDADNVHAHRVLVEDGGTGPPTDIGANFVTLVANHNQADYFPDPPNDPSPGEGVYALVGFDDKLPPEPQGPEDQRPLFVSHDEDGNSLISGSFDDLDAQPLDVPPNSPILTVTQGYLRLHLLQGNSNIGPNGNQDRNGGDLVLFEVWPVSGGEVTPQLQAGDADQDLDFDQLDLVQVQVSAKYLTGQPATWGEGDWNGAPGGKQGEPPAGDGQFNQLDIIAALNAGFYLTGPYAALDPEDGVVGDDQTSLVYDTSSGELRVDAPAGKELTSINITSDGSKFIGDKPAVLDGAFDNFAADNIFKATFGGSFGDISFGNVLAPGMSADDLKADLTAVGSLAGGGDLGAVDLVWVPEPSSIILLALGLAGALSMRRRRT